MIPGFELEVLSLFMTCVDFELIVTWSSVIQPIKRPEMEEVDNNGRQFGLLDYVFD